jgi:hypothetical protein
MPLNAVERLKSMKKKRCLLPTPVVDSHTHFMLHWMPCRRRKEGRKEGSINRLLNYEPFDELPMEVHQAQK